jgi:hypothetical protein
MKRNMGFADRVIRLIIAAVIIAAGFYYKNCWGLVAIIPLLTGLWGFCPLYALLGIKTCKVK